jgi:hypothetical protein
VYDDDSASPVWLLVLLAILHGSLWLALGFDMLILLPRLQQVVADFNMKLPYMMDFILLMSRVYVRLPFLILLLPAFDGLVLFLVHRVLPSRALRFLWSLFVLLGLLGFVLWASLGYLLTMEKLMQGLSR